MRKIKIILILALLANSFSAFAMEIPNLAPYIKSDSIYGKSTYKWFLVDVYDATLLTDAEKWSMDSSFALSIEYKMNFTAKELIDKSIEEMENIKPFAKDQKEKYTKYLNEIMPSVKKGERITSLHIKDKGIKLYHNQRLVGEISDDKFAKDFLGIWLSEKTSAPDFRKRLLSRKE